MKIITKINKGDLCIECTFKISTHDTSIVDLKNNTNLPFCLEDAHLPMAETRLIEAIDSTVYPVRVEVVEFINKKIEQWQERVSIKKAEAKAAAAKVNPPKGSSSFDFREFLHKPIPIGDEEEKAASG
jgi:hypothetical protein